MPAGPAFQSIFLRLWVKIQNSAPNIFLPHCLDSPRIKTLGEDRSGTNPLLQDKGQTPQAPGSDSLPRKLLAMSMDAPENFIMICYPGQKLWTIIPAMHRQTDKRSKVKYPPCPIGKNLPFHFVKLALLVSLCED